jgi:SulP family sulfate permease
VLAAILISVSLKMGDWDIRKAFQFPKRDTAVLIVTFVLTVVFDLTVAVQIGLLMAAVFFIRSMASHTSVNRLLPEYAQLFERHTIAGKHVPDGCAAFRVEGALFLGRRTVWKSSISRPSRRASSFCNCTGWCCWIPPACWRWTV